MVKKIIIGAVVLLIVLLFVLYAMTRPKPSDNQNKNLVSPTTVPVDSTSQPLPDEVDNEIINSALPLTPYEDENFRFDYQPDTNQLIVQEKTEDGEQKFIEWANLNGLPELISITTVIKYEKGGSTNGKPYSIPEKLDPLMDFLNIFLNYGRGEQLNQSESAQKIGDIAFNNQLPKSTDNKISTQKTYFAQCNGFGDIPLPSGCNLCEAGCGPTTVSMIASSLLGDKYDPKEIVNMYKARGYYLGCSGSRYQDAKAILESLGLKTTSYLQYSNENAKSVASDFDKYIQGGWTMFTLANFREDGGGHFFWVTDVDENGNILAYDPYYGKSTAPPYNENSKFPFPLYRLAFGVKKI